jgi:hypothetical protein
MAIETNVTLICEDDKSDTITASIDDDCIRFEAASKFDGVCVLVKPSEARQFAHHILALVDKAESTF